SGAAFCQRCDLAARPVHVGQTVQVRRRCYRSETELVVSLRLLAILVLGSMALTGSSAAQSVSSTTAAVSDTGNDGREDAPQSPSEPPSKTDDTTIAKKKKRLAKKSATKEQPGLHLGKHPSLTLGSAVTLEFKARIEGDVRAATPDIGLDQTDAEWND